MFAVRYRLKIDIDTKNVERAYARGERQALTRAAARLRLYARRRMRRRSRPSRPGEGPTVRQGQLKRFLLYAYEPRHGTAVIGPKRLSGATGDTPATLEHGGRLRRWVGRGRSRARRLVLYEQRPSTMPALERVQPDLPSFWNGVIK